MLQRRAGSSHLFRESLFRVPPPAALAADDLMLYLATRNFLARRRQLLPEDVWLTRMEPDATPEWSQASVAHVPWNRAPVMRRPASWANHVGRGRVDIRGTPTKAGFIMGGNNRMLERVIPK